MKFYICILSALLVFFSCKNDANTNESATAYLGGEIINPVHNFIQLYKSEKIVDTIKLDGRNRFMYKIKNLEAGLYTFKHGGEFQVILLEPNDSLLFRLNTLDFDESLVYTGRGSKKNNYFINEFLNNEKIEKKVYEYCQLNSESYITKIDSIQDIKTKKLNKFIEKYNPSDLFKDIAEINKNYGYYFSKEVYPLWHYTKNKRQVFDALPNDFYNYRKHIDYNNERLTSNIIYNTYLRSNFNNMALNKHYSHIESDQKYNDKMFFCYNLDRLSLVDSLVSNKNIKDELLHHFTFTYLAKSRNSEYNNMVLNSYLEKSTNESNKKKVTRFANSLKNLAEGLEIPNVKVLDYGNTEHDITAIISSPTVISFWSHTFYDHFKESHHKVNELKEKYPEIKFISINIDNYGLEKSKISLKNNRFSCNNEYYFKEPKKSIEVFAIHPMNKTLIINKHKKIVNSNTNMFSSKFEEQLLGLLNR